MTGRDLIVYILESHLEDVELFSDVTKPFLIPLEKAAVELGCGMATVIFFQQKSKGQNEMHNKLAATLLTLAGICFVSGMALLLS